MLNAYFRVQGYEVTVANFGEDGVRLTQELRPDLLILDIRLPDIDGFEVAHRVRTDRKTSGIPIIFLTEKRDRSDKLRGLELGADDYITKPFDVQELRLRVRNALKRSTQDTLTNPVTGLPEGAVVDERLSECLNRDNYSILLVSLENIDRFREVYGFVASDDVMRAVSMMIHNAMRELDCADDFFGHLFANEFVLIVQPSVLSNLEERIRSRLEQSLDYFYPLRDREEIAKRPDRLAVRIGKAEAGETFSGLAQLKTEISNRKV
jgi:DNA-binding response OmpR family regulator